MREQWKIIEGFYGKYSISNYGQVMNNNTCRILKPRVTGDGYYQVSLYSRYHMRQYLVHRLVAEYFLDNPMNYNTVHFIDEDKTNCAVYNLEWMSREEAHRITRGKHNTMQDSFSNV